MPPLEDIPSVHELVEHLSTRVQGTPRPIVVDATRAVLDDYRRCLVETGAITTASAILNVNNTSRAIAGNGTMTIASIIIRSSGTPSPLPISAIMFLLDPSDISISHRHCLVLALVNLGDRRCEIFLPGFMPIFNLKNISKYLCHRRIQTGRNLMSKFGAAEQGARQRRGREQRHMVFFCDLSDSRGNQIFAFVINIFLRNLPRKNLLKSLKPLTIKH